MALKWKEIKGKVLIKRAIFYVFIVFLVWKLKTLQERTIKE